jgi:hypothetical protein
MLVEQYFLISLIVFRSVSVHVLNSLKLVSTFHAPDSKGVSPSIRRPMIESRIQLWKGGVLRRRNLHQSTKNTVN